MTKLEYETQLIQLLRPLTNHTLVCWHCKDINIMYPDGHPFKQFMTCPNIGAKVRRTYLREHSYLIRRHFGCACHG